MPTLQEEGAFIPSCDTCLKNPQLKQAFGCVEESQNGPWGVGFKWSIGGKISRRCPRSGERDPWVQAVLRLYAAWQRGDTPTGEPFAHSPKHYTDSMILVENFVEEAKVYASSAARKEKWPRGISK